MKRAAWIVFLTGNREKKKQSIVLNSFYFFGFKSEQKKFHSQERTGKISVLTLPKMEKKYVFSLIILFNFSLIVVNVIPINFT